MALTTIGDETISVTDTVVGLSLGSSGDLLRSGQTKDGVASTLPSTTGAHKYNMPGTRMARITIISGSMHVSTNGVITAPTDGGNFPIFHPTESFEVWDLPDMSTIRFVENGAVTCVIFVEYEGTVE